MKLTVVQIIHDLIETKDETEGSETQGTMISVPRTVIHATDTAGQSVTAVVDEEGWTRGEQITVSIRRANRAH